MDDPYATAWHWLDPEWDDLAVLRQVEEAVASGRIVLPEKRYPDGPPYNGASGAERTLGGKLFRASQRMGLTPWYDQCSICGRRGRCQYHNEDYSRPCNAKPICQPCHRTLHRRFRHSGPWLDLVALHGPRWPVTMWFETLSMIEVPPPPTPDKPRSKTPPRSGLEKWPKP